jgi:hypothetical protein
VIVSPAVTTEAYASNREIVKTPDESVAPVVSSSSRDWLFTTMVRSLMGLPVSSSAVPPTT